MASATVTKLAASKTVSLVATLDKDTPKAYRYSLDRETNPNVFGNLYVAKSAIKGDAPPTLRVNVTIG